MGISSSRSLKVQLLSPEAIEPARKSKNASGYDCFSPCNLVIQPNTRALLKLDISIEFPKGYYARLAPRSSCAMMGIDIGAGVVDWDYRGNLGVVIVNNSTTAFNIARGDRVCQLILEKITNPRVKVVKALSLTIRGKGGFGSTGK